MKVLSVCSGIGTDAVAWHPLGWEHLCFAEIEKFPSAVLKHRWPDIPNRGDFTQIGTEYRGAADLLVGGTPCQSFSVAGLRGGLADDRGNLALEFLRLADRTRPRWVVWENVPGVLSSLSHIAPDPCPPPPPMDLGCDGAEVETEDEYSAEELHALNCFVAGLSELGYGWAFRIFDAQYFGVPQRRRRVFVVGHLGDWRRAAAVLFERHSLQGDHPPRREKGQRVAPNPVSCAQKRGGFGWSEYREYAPTLQHEGGLHTGGLERIPYVMPILEAGARTGTSTDDPRCGIGVGEAGDPMFTLQSGKQHAVAFRTAGDGAVFEEGDLTAPLTTQTDPSAHVIAFSAGQSSKAGSIAAREEQSPTLRGAASGTNQVPAVAFAQNTRDEVREMPYAGALAAEPGMKQQSYIRNGMALRRLTPRECERLQGLPDDYTLIPYNGKPAADGPRYKAIGNGMAVPVVSWIGVRIQQVENLATHQPQAEGL